MRRDYPPYQPPRMISDLPSPSMGGQSSTLFDKLTLRADALFKFLDDLPQPRGIRRTPEQMERFLPGHEVLKRREHHGRLAPAPRDDKGLSVSRDLIEQCFELPAESRIGDGLHRRVPRVHEILNSNSETTDPRARQPDLSPGGG